MEKPYGKTGQCPKEAIIMRDYLDLNDADFDVFFNNLNQYVDGKCDAAPPEWTHIPSAPR
jgi:hypothetical protein